MVAALAMPMILHAAAWEATAGKFGWLPLTQTGSRATGLTAFGAFGGLTACGWIHGLVGAAMTALATWHGVRTVPQAILDQASLERSPSSVWWRIRLPLAMPWMATALLATAALAATEMTVVDLYGFRTVADEFYLYFAVSPTSTSLAMMCVLPIVIGSILMAVVTSFPRERISVRRNENRASGLLTSPNKSTGKSTSKSRGAERWLGPRRSTTIAAGVWAMAVATMILLVPVAGLFVKAGHQVRVRDDRVEVHWSVQQAATTLATAPTDYASEYGWTIMLSVITGVVAILIAWPLAALARSSAAIGRLADLISIAMFMIPGPVIGLLVVRLFRMDVPAFDMLYQRTLIPTTIALLFRAAPPAYWVMRAGYRVMDPTLIDAARLDGSFVARMWTIDRGMLATSCFVAFAGSCLIASGDVPATLPVIPPGVTTVGTRLFGLLHSGARQQEAVLAIWYVGGCIAVALFGLWRIQNREMRRS
tara:strand:+ start:446915 stop:448351 length:1437 start_codon:yes stop_codon:yes gene_type:complete